MRITDRIIEIPNYLKDGGSYNDVVIFTRMSMRRNVSDYYFPNKMTDDEREEFRKNITEYLENKKLFPVHYKLKDLSFEERGILVERFILNERLEAKPQDAFLMLNNEIDSGLILNYEDHLIFFNLFPGLEVNQNFENLVSSFYIISKEFKICIDEQFGYLTSSPFYTGTGIILEAFLHLPGISITNRFKELVFDATEKGFVIYPYFEEKGSASGSIFVIRNKFTLKYSEEEIMEYFKKFVENIIMIEYRERC
jgi:protein arginine kinase